MKIFYLLILIALLGLDIYAQEAPKNELSVSAVSNYKEMFVSGSWYFSSQPNYEQLLFLKEEGVQTVINLRSKEENKSFSESAFSEKDLSQQLGLNYYSIPVKGKEGFNKRNMTEFASVLNKAEGKILIHCKEGGRVTYFMMAYLIQEKGFSEEEAIEFGKQLTYYSPLDALLGK